MLEDVSPGSQGQCFMWGISSVISRGTCCFSEPPVIQLGGVRAEVVTPSWTRLHAEARRFQTFLPTWFLNTASTMKPLFFLGLLLISRQSCHVITAKLLSFGENCSNNTLFSSIVSTVSPSEYEHSLLIAASNSEVFTLSHIPNFFSWERQARRRGRVHPCIANVKPACLKLLASYLPGTPGEEVGGSPVLCGPAADKQEARSPHRRKWKYCSVVITVTLHVQEHKGKWDGSSLL